MSDDLSGLSPEMQQQLQEHLAASPTEQQPGVPAPAPEAPQLEGLSPDMQSEIQKDLNEQKFGTLPEMAKTLLEGAAQGFAGPAATLAESSALGNAPEMLARKEVNPVTHAVGEIGTLVGGALTGTGVGGMLAKFGGAATTQAAKFGAGRIGSAAVAGAIENMAYQGQSEVSKMILADPTQTVDTAVTDVGLAGVIGGAFGTVPALWRAATGSHTAQALGSFTKKLGGIEGVVPDAIEDVIAKTGMDIAPEVRAGLSSDPQIQHMFKRLEQTDLNASGLELQKSYGQFRKDAGDAVITSLGKTPDEVEAMSQLSKYDAGKTIGDTLASEYQEQVGPLSQIFETLKTKFKNIPLEEVATSSTGDVIPGTTAELSDKIARLAADEGWTASPSSDIMREVNRTLKELPLQKTVKNLSDFITQVQHNMSSDPMNGPLRRAGGMVSRILKEAEADIIAKRLGEVEGPTAVESFNAARAAYAEQSGLRDALNSRLHVGGSTSGFAKAIREMAKTDGEAVVRRLSGVNDAELLQFMATHYPRTAELVKSFHINEMLQAAAGKAKPGMTINTEAFLNKFEKLSPELKAFIAGPEAQAKMQAVGTLLSEFNKLPHNYSNTARVLDKAMAHMPGSALGVAHYLNTHNPVSSSLIGAFTKLVGRDVPDAVRLALLKALGSPKRVSSEGFKNMVEVIAATIKGENLIAKATKNVFKAGSEVIPAHLMPTDRDRVKLQKELDKLKHNPEKMFNIAGNTGHYMPDHAAAIGETAARAVQLLNNIKPNTSPQNPLDNERPMSLIEKAKYNRVLDIAQQPLVVLEHIAAGTLTPEDVSLQKTLYPALYQKLSKQLMEHVIATKTKGDIIPYKTKLGLSLYLGQALDATMTPAGIQAAQPKQSASQNQATDQQQGPSEPKHSSASLTKMPNMYRTPGQSAERDRGNRPSER